MSSDVREQSNETLPSKSQAARSSGAINVEELRRWVYLLVALGIAWRLARYLLAFPFWGDEAYLNINYLYRDSFELMLPLEYAQVAPVGFLWLQKWLFDMFGGGEYALRLLPLIASIAALLIFAKLAWGMLPPRAAAIAIGLFAGSYYLVRHGVESKQYSTDLFTAIAVLAIGAFWLERVRSHDRALFTGVVGAAGIWLSLPAAFVAGGVGIAAVLQSLSEKAWRALGWCAAYGLMIGVSFLLLYTLVLADQSDAAKGTWLEYYWRDSFPPREVLGFSWWLVKVHTGLMAAYPFGGHDGRSVATTVLALFGLVSLLRKQRWMAVVLLAAPALLGIVAALMHKYPYGGSLRVTIYMAPAFCLLAGAGGGYLIDQVLAVRYRDFVGGVLGAMLLALPFGGGLFDVLNPYKEKLDPYFRQVVEDKLVQDFKAGDLIGIHNPMMGDHDGPEAMDGPMFAQSLRYYFELETGVRPLWRESGEYTSGMQYVFALHGVRLLPKERWKKANTPEYENYGPTAERVAAGVSPFGLGITPFREYMIYSEGKYEIKLVVYRCVGLSAGDENR